MLSIFLIGLALSMDAFSLSLGLGMLKLNKNQKLNMAFSVGLFHFIMPIVGIYISNNLSTIFEVNLYLLNIFIFIYAGILMIFDKNSKDKAIEYSIINMLLLSISVSIDSFSVGLGLKVYAINYIVPSTIFFFCSFIITYLGLITGEYSIKHLKEKAPILGGMIFFILAIVNIIKQFT